MEAASYSKMLFAHWHIISQEKPSKDYWNIQTF